MVNFVKNKYYFKVAGFNFVIESAVHVDVEEILPSYLPFRWDRINDELLLFTLRVEFVSPTREFEYQGRFIVSDENDMGHLTLYGDNKSYMLSVSRVDEDKLSHRMFASPDFSHLVGCLRLGRSDWGLALDSMLRFAFSQAILPYRALSVHASAVYAKGFVYLFMGKSGTGKSTHARLWLDTVDGAQLLNDDNPILRIADGGSVLAFGSPWSGKTPCYKNKKGKLRAAVRLYQANTNKYMMLSGVDAFAELLPSCISLSSEPLFYEKLCDTLQLFVEAGIVVGRLQCLPQKEAAELCYNETNKFEI